MLTRRGFLTQATFTAVGSLGIASSGFAEAQSVPGVRRITISLPRLPEAWDGLRILQVSDVHAGLYMSVQRMREIAGLLARLPSDLIVFTGDQVDCRAVDADMFSEGFRGLEAPLGVYGILGNHDHYVGRTLARRALTGAGITPLVNRATELRRGRQRLTLVGVDDLYARGGGPDFNLIGRHPERFHLCLCHQPQGWRGARAAGADLTLSGHTHGGQIALPSRNLSLARLTTRYVAGPYRWRQTVLYVSRGIGVGAVPLRVGAPPEIDVITLRRKPVALSAAA